jgi:hypothetical protein
MNHRFIKTAAGSAEIQSRKHELSLELRRLLILVDAARDVAQLQTMLAGENVAAGIEELLRLRLIEPFVGTARPATVEAPARPRTVEIPARPATVEAPARPAGTAPAGNTVADAKRRAVRALNDMLGPDAERYALAIERCNTGDELRACIRETEQFLQRVRGASAAATLIKAVRSGG